MKRFSGKLSIPGKSPPVSGAVSEDEISGDSGTAKGVLTDPIAFREVEETEEAKPWLHKKAVDKIREKKLWQAFWVFVVLLLMAGAVAGAYFVGRWDASRNRNLAEGSGMPVLKEREPPNEQALSMVDSGVAAEHAGKAKIALEEFRAAADRDPNVFGIDYLIARAAFKAGDRAMAEKYAEIAIAKDQRAADAHVLLALIAWTSRRANEQRMIPAGDEAMIHLEKAMALEPANPMPFYFAGDILRERGSIERGTDYLRKAEYRMDAADAYLAIRVKRMLGEAQMGQRAPGEPTGLDELFPEAFLAVQAGDKERFSKLLDEIKRFAPRQVMKLLLHDVAFRDAAVTVRDSVPTASPKPEIR